MGQPASKGTGCVQAARLLKGGPLEHRAREVQGTVGERGSGGKGSQGCTGAEEGQNVTRVLGRSAVGRGQYPGEEEHEESPETRVALIGEIFDARQDMAGNHA